MDKKKLIAIIVFLVLGFTACIYANEYIENKQVPADTTKEEETNSPSDTDDDSESSNASVVDLTIPKLLGKNKINDYSSNLNIKDTIKKQEIINKGINDINKSTSEEDINKIVDKIKDELDKLVCPVISNYLNSSKELLTNKDVVTSWTITDNGSISKVEYSTDQVSWIPLSSSNWYGITKTSTINETIYVRATDNDNNISNIIKVVFNIDTDVPVITVNTDSKGSVDSKIYTKLSLSITDNVSVSKMYLNGSLVDDSNVDMTNITYATKDAQLGLNTLEVEDTAGNKTTYEFYLQKELDKNDIENIYDIKFKKDTITYDGKEHSLTVSNLPSDFSVTYKSTIMYSTNTFKNAGSYQVEATIKGNSNYTGEYVLSAPLNINRAKVTVDVDNLKSLETEDILPFTYKVTGLQGTDSLDIALSSNFKKEVGTYHIYGSLQTNPINDNYDVTIKNGTYEVKPDKNNNKVDDDNDTKYTVKYCMDGTCNSEAYLIGMPITVKDNMFTKDNYLFNSWSDNNTTYKPGNVLTADKDYTFEPVWDEDFNNNSKPDKDETKYSIKYRSSSSTTSMPSDETGVLPGTTQDLSTKIPTRYGYTFTGWTSTTATITNNEYVMPEHNVTLHANWTESPASYKIVTMMENIDNDDYTIVSEETETYLTDKSTTYVPAGIVGYTVDSSSTLSGIIKYDGSLTLTVIYKRNRHTVTYISDDKTVSSTEYKYGQNVELLADPTKDGYTFNGWTTKDVNVQDGKFNMPNNDVTLTADFTPNKATYKVVTQIENIDNDDYIVSEETKDSYTDVVVSTTPEAKDGYTVDSSSTLSGTVKSDNSLTLTVIYKRNRHTVTYIVDNKTISKEYKYGQDVEVLKNPTKDGYTFNGWTTDVTIQDGKFNMPDKDVTLTASFTQIYFTVEIREENANDNGYIVKDSWKVYSDNDDTLYDHKYIEYVLDANYTEEGCYSDPGTSTMDGYVKADNTMKIIVNFKRYHYNLRYLDDKGNVIKDYTYKFGQTIAPVPDPTKEGYIFTGWDKTITTMPNYSLELTAQFRENTANYTVITSYEDVNDDKYETNVTTETKTGRVGTTVSATTSDQRGFYLNTTLSNTSGTVQEDGSLVLHIYYKRKVNTVNYKTDNSTIFHSEQYKYGQTIPAYTGVPTREGYTFIKWFRDCSYICDNTVMGDDGFDLFAKWEANQTGISVDVNKNVQLIFKKGTKASLPNGVTVYAVYADGTSKAVTDYTTNIDTSSVGNNKKLEITYNGFTNNSLTYSIVDKSVSTNRFDLSLNDNKNKLTFINNTIDGTDVYRIGMIVGTRSEEQKVDYTIKKYNVNWKSEYSGIWIYYQTGKEYYKIKFVYDEKTNTFTATELYNTGHYV